MDGVNQGSLLLIGKHVHVFSSLTMVQVAYVRAKFTFSSITTSCKADKHNF